MKLKTLVIPNFFNDETATYHKDVTILYNPQDNELTLQNFDVYYSQFYLVDSEIDRLAAEAAVIMFHGNAILWEE